MEINMYLSKLFFSLSMSTLLLIPSDLHAEIVKDGNDSSVVATILGPAGMSIPAINNDVRIIDEGPTLSVIIPSGSFKTGIDLRDEHLAEAIDARKYPSVTVTLLDSDIKIPISEDAVRASAPATLIFHGITRHIKIDYVAATDCEGHIGVKADFDIDVRDYSVSPPSYFGVGIRPNVHVHTWIRLIDIDGC